MPVCVKCIYHIYVLGICDVYNTSYEFTTHRYLIWSTCSDCHSHCELSIQFDISSHNNVPRNYDHSQDKKAWKFPRSRKKTFVRYCRLFLMVVICPVIYNDRHVLRLELDEPIAAVLTILIIFGMMFILLLLCRCLNHVTSSS